MIPYSNRIADGFFRFDKREFQLDHADTHAIHGDVRKRKWDVVEQSSSHLQCNFSSRDHKNVNWPWPFDARYTATLSDQTIRQELSLTNRGRVRMPAGMGFHPYFLRSLTRDQEPVALTFNFDSVYPDENDTRIPSGPAEPRTDDMDFSKGELLSPDAFIDACCAGYDQKGHIEWPESSVRLHFACSKTIGHLVLPNPTPP